MNYPNRRQALWTVPAALAGTPLIAAAADTPVARENRLPGTTDWQLTYVKFDGKEKYRSRLIEGYCSRTSVRPGDAPSKSSAWATTRALAPDA